VSITRTPSISVTPSVSITRTPSESVTPSVSITRTPSISVTPSVSITATPSISVTPSLSVALYNIQWSWVNNNTAGGYLQILVNGTQVVYESGANVSNSFNVTPGDYISVNMYAYANASIGAQACLTVENPQGTTPIYNNCDTQYNPGSPASNSYGTYYPTANGAIAAQVNEV